tara:strand:+ start:1404 stop:2912 length:1509 start_codon:yes stop_codon:yes gene_type:complete
MTKPIVINRKPLNQSIGREGMSRSLFLSILCAGFFLNIAVANAGGTQAIDTRPNILFILLDDLGKEWVSAYGAEEIKTPNIDKLAETGIKFQNVWSNPQCTPSRVALMTGQYPFRNGWVNHWDTPRWGDGYFDWRLNPSMASILKNSGYATVAAGKWQINDFRLEPNVMQKHGFDDYAMWTGYEAGNPASAERYWDPYIHTQQGSKTYKGQFGEDIFSDFIIDFVAEHKDQPWFAYYPMNLPHTPLTTTPLEPEVRGEYEQHKAMVRYADFILAKMLRALEELGERENTIVVWTTDNGTAQSLAGMLNGRKVNGGKTRTTENGINAPFIVNAPGLTPAGVITDALVDFTDLLPTFAELAGAQLPINFKFDGSSFAGLVLGDSDDSKRQSILAMGGKNEAGRSAQGVENAYVYRDRVIRDKRYKLFVQSSPERGYEKLVDLATDPEEKVNLLESNNSQIVAAKNALQRVAESLPQKDNDPKYNKRAANPWDVPVSVESQVWKQ